MNNKINKYKYPIIIILLCIVCIILVAVFFPEYKGLYVLFALGIIVSGVYLIRKYKKTAKVAPDSLPNSLLSSADNENLDPEIYEQIEKHRQIAIANDFDREFYDKYVGNHDNFSKFRIITRKYLINDPSITDYFKVILPLNNDPTIEDYFKVILPLFDDTHKKNVDDLKKDIIKYVVLYDFPEFCKKVSNKMPLRCKILLDLYIKDIIYINNKNLDQEIYKEIYKQIEKNRKIAIKYNFHYDFLKKYEVIDDNFIKFREITINSLNNDTTIEDYFNKILPLFNVPYNKNVDDLKKDIIKYVVLYDFPKFCNKVDNKMPPRCKILLDLYIKDNIYIINKNTAKVAPDPSGAADDKDLDPEIYNQIAIYKSFALTHTNFNEEFQKYFKGPTDETDESSSDDEQIRKHHTFLSQTENYLNNNSSIEEYYKQILPLFDTDDLKKNIIKYVVFYYLPKYNKKGVEKPHNYKILVDLYIKNQIKNDVDNILQKSRKYWKRPDYTNLQALTLNARTQLNTMYNSFKTDYEKNILIAYIKELLKDVKEKDVNDIITEITTPPSYGSGFMRN